MTMPESEARKKWVKENSIIFSIKLMKRTEGDIIDFLDKLGEQGVPRGTIFKKAIREYMENHKGEGGC